MSTCISTHGEYSEHTPDKEFVCTRCYVLDEEALKAEMCTTRKRIKRLRKACRKASQDDWGIEYLHTSTILGILDGTR